MARSKKRKRQEEEESRPWFDLRPEIKKDVAAVLLVAASVVTILAYLGKAGVAGDMLDKAGEGLFGWGFLALPVILILIAVAIYRGEEERRVLPSTVAGSVLLLLSVLGLLQMFFAPNGGGVIGKGIHFFLIQAFGAWAAIIILAALFIVSLIIFLNISLWRIFKRAPGQEKEKQEESPRVAFPDGSSVSLDEMESGIDKKLDGIFNKIIPRPRFRVKDLEEEENDDLSQDKEERGEFIPSLAVDELAEGFEHPPLDLLGDEKGAPQTGDVRVNANIIKRTLDNFGIEVEMADINIGPTVTQYTLKPATGVKLSSITALQKDLSLALAAHPIRIEAPIPGRSAVGIEVPNRAVSMVRLRNIIESPAFAGRASNLTLSLGRDVSGSPVVADLAKMPHLLVAGATGSGKSVAINGIILSLLYQNAPDTLRLILIDPKRVEFSLYNGIPYLLTPVVTDNKKTLSVFRWAVGEMERRYEKLSEAGVRDIDSYNKRLAKQDPAQKPMPYIVIVVDELADIMSSYGRDVEGVIVRLAQMARAVGIHLILSTQRPSVEVITGLIKANIIARVAFQVASQIDSRTILDMAGAEKLLGNGDMLFLSPARPHPFRVQGVYVGEKEVKKVVDFLKKRGEADYEDDVSESARDEGMFGGSDHTGDDELFEEAKRVVLEAKKASSSLLQRRLRVGYARAARLIDLLEDAGVVGPADGSKPREVYAENYTENDDGADPEDNRG